MAVKDLVSGVLAESITTSTTNILVTIAQNIGASEIQAFFPTPPFYITIMPKSPAVGVANRLDSEIIQVTAVGHDQVGNAALTGVRAQRDTTAKAFSAGDIVTVGVYTDDAVLLGGTGTTETIMAIKKQLKDKDGNTIYPDVGLNLDDVVYSDDPEPIEKPEPWVNTNDIVDDAITPNKASFTTYSTTETVVGTWIDGKPIYRKVIKIANPTVSNTDYDLVSSNISTLVRLWGYMVTSNGTIIPAPQTESSSTYSAIFLKPTGVLRGRFSYSGSVPSAAVMIVEYTKTTD